MTSTERQADPTPHTDPTAAAVRKAQAEALREAADEIRATFADPDRRRPLFTRAEVTTDFANDAQWAEQIVRDRADRLATDTPAPEGVCDAVEDQSKARCCKLVDHDGPHNGWAHYPGQLASWTDPAAPVAVEGVETVETLAEALRAELGPLLGVHTHVVVDAFLASDWLAARIVQARAGEGALRKRVEALTSRWEKEAALRGDDDRLYTKGVAAMLRAALDPEATT